MKLPVAAFALVVVCTTSLVAQQKVDISIDDLRTPASPAFVLLGVAPTAVERPVTPRALGLSLLSAFEETGGGVPRNFSIEVAPYWLTPHPELNYDKFDEAGFLQSLKQTFSVSFATKSPVDRDSETAADEVAEAEPARFGLSARASWTLGKRSSAAQAAIDQLINSLQAIANEPPPADATAQELRQLAKEKAERATKTTASLSKNVRQAARQGRVVVDVAAAMSGRFEEDKFDDRRHEKTAFWVTPSYRLDRAADKNLSARPASVDFVGVLRYLDDRTSNEGAALDFGARVVWENDLLAISGEHLRRTNVEDDSERTAVVIEFKLNDDIYLTGTLGEDFKSADDNDGNLLALFGINFNVGRKPSLRK